MLRKQTSGPMLIIQCLLWLTLASVLTQNLDSPYWKFLPVFSNAASLLLSSSSGDRILVPTGFARKTLSMHLPIKRVRDSLAPLSIVKTCDGAAHSVGLLDLTETFPFAPRSYRKIFVDGSSPPGEALSRVVQQGSLTEGLKTLRVDFDAGDSWTLTGANPRRILPCTLCERPYSVGAGISVTHPPSSAEHPKRDCPHKTGITLGSRVMSQVIMWPVS